MRIQANYINILEREINFSQINIENGKIESIVTLQSGEKSGEFYILPGFVDAHVHVESSLLCPAQFARMAVVHGTVGTVSDPHEIANVLGIKGIVFMLENAAKVPFHFCFGASPCVPATNFETAGAKISPADIQFLFENYPQIGYLAEVMNFPGVLNNDPDMLEKIAIAQSFKKPIDGHAPGLRGELAKKYAKAGPQTDHECYSLAEAQDKLEAGMKIIIREGSAAKNFEELIPLMGDNYENIMFCSDDKHPDELAIGHINLLVKRAQNKGFDLFNILQVACINPVKHYNLPIGLLEIGDPADFILVENLQDFNILATYLGGEKVAEKGASYIESIEAEPVNFFNCTQKSVIDFQLKNENHSKIKVIEVIDSQLITSKSIEYPKIENGNLVANESEDILKIVVVNRYSDQPIAIAFIKNFGIKNGAIASSVAHDSHNIIAVGSSDEALCEAVNLVIYEKGGLSAIQVNGEKKCLQLPMAGIMSVKDGYWVAQKYTEIDQFSKNILKSTLKSPFMSLSFMALLVIPSLKLSDKGLFDGDKFEFTSIGEF
ncbi:MAG: adenine deaminase [Bacteroidota bacterium]